MKKLIALILIAGVLLSIMVFPSYAASETKNKANILYKLGCIDEESLAMLSDNRSVSRGEFAAVLYKTAKLSTVNAVKFNDVSSEDGNYEAICAVSGSGIMKGDGNGNFNPGKTVTELDAVVSILRFLGYEEYAAYNGGYPAGYYATARKTGLLSETGGITSDELKGNKLSVLLANMLDEPLYSITFVEGDSYEKTATEKTVLNMYYSAGKISDVVTGNTGTLLNSAKETGGIIVREKFISVDNSEFDNLIGMHCDAYYSLEDNSLIYIEPTDENEIDVIPSYDIISVSGGDIIYELSEGKEKKVSFPSDAYILYNGRHLKHYTESVISDIEAGEVKLIDNDSDGKIEVVSIISYETVIIDKVNSKDELVTFKFGMGSVTEKDLKDVFIYGAQGRTGLDWLHEWDALDILKDDNGKIVMIYAAGRLERKSATGVSVDSKRGYITFDDETTAPVRLEALKKLDTLELNVKYCFSFDSLGNVVAFTKDALDKICVLIAVGEQGALEPSLKIKYYSENGKIERKELEGNIKLNNVLRNVNKSSDYVVVKETLEAAEGDLVEINTTNSGKIESISIMEKVYDSGKSAVTTYLNNYATAVCPSANEQYFVKKSANAFYVPKELSNVTESDFAIKNVTAVGTRTIAVVVYKKFGSEDIDADAVKFVKNVSGMDSMGSYDNPMLVSEKSKIYMEDEGLVYTKLCYWHSGTEKTALVKDADVIADIDEGDVAWIDVDEGEIVGVVKYFDYSEKKDFPAETTTPKGFTASRKMNHGYVINAEDELYQFAIKLSITSKDSSGNEVVTDSEKIELHRYPTYGYVFDSTKANKVRKATAADFIGYETDPVNYSKVFVHSSYTTDYMAVVYK